MDQTNSLVGPDAPAAPQRPRRRRPHARARADRGARRPPDPLRPHVPDRDAGGPEHRPDRLAARATPQVSEHGFVTTPYRVVKNGKVTDEIVHLDATEEQERADRAGQRAGRRERQAAPATRSSAARRPASTCTSRPSDVDLIDVSPEQIWSVATAMIPFLEHDDANRALMGSNMQRQAVPLLKTDAPLIGTGMERRAALDTGDVVAGRATPARSTSSTPTRIVVDRRGRRATSTSCRSSCAPTRAR